MHDTQALLRSRNRWRAIAVALGLGHLVVAVALYFVLSRDAAQVAAVAAAEKAAMVARAVAVDAMLSKRLMQIELASHTEGVNQEKERQLSEAWERERTRRASNPFAERADVESR